MNDITRFSPLNELARFDPFGDMDDVFNRFMMRPFSRKTMEIGPQIKMDVKEADGKYMVKAEIPGVNKDDIHVTVDGNMVSISAEVKQEKEEKEGQTAGTDRLRAMRCRLSCGALAVDQSPFKRASGKMSGLPSHSRQLSCRLPEPERGVFSITSR